MAAVSELERLLREKEDVNNNDKNNNEKQEEQQLVPVVEKPPVDPAPIAKPTRKMRRLASRPGFRMQGMALGKFFMKCRMETKLFFMPCYIRFVITHEGKHFVRHVYPFDCIGDFAHFHFKSYTYYPIRLRIYQRNPGQETTLVVDEKGTKEYEGVINSFGKTIPRGHRKPFRLFFLPWRKRILVLAKWENSRDPRL